jgi:hypothetical protein
MRVSGMKGGCLFTALLTSCLAAQTAPKSINPTIKKIVAEISEERIASNLKKLESFETRNIFSEQTNPTHGIGAARKWIYDQLQSYSPRLQVSLDGYKLKKQTRVIHAVEIANVVALLPGTLNAERQFIVSGHYDSMSQVFKPGKGLDTAEPSVDDEQTADAPLAPGVTDDASGTAAVLELARVMSQFEFKKTIVFIAFAGEEEGLLGSRLYAAKAHSENRIIDAVLNNDIIGSDVAGDGRIDNRTVRVFSEEPADSPSRQLARYIQETGARYVPWMKVDFIFRHDRFARGGDHTPFNAAGYAAVRFTTPAENYSNQHTPTDSFANTSPAYTAQVTRVNAAALASLALAPKTPVVTRAIKTGPRKGEVVANIARGKSRYDAVLKWTNDAPEADLAGYAVVMRSTIAPFWEKEIWVGNVSEFALESVSIDDTVFGVKAVDKDGNESLVSAYVAASFPAGPVEVY